MTHEIWSNDRITVNPDMSSTRAASAAGCRLDIPPHAAQKHDLPGTAKREEAASYVSSRCGRRVRGPAQGQRDRRDVPAGTCQEGHVCKVVSAGTCKAAATSI